MCRSPLSAASAAFQVTSRAASVSTAISARSSWTSWNDAIERPNCCRSRAYASDASRHPWAIPTQPAASEIRPLSSAESATFMPSPSPASTFSAGTRTPSSVSSPVSCARSPSLPLIGCAEKPGESVGTRKQVTRSPVFAKTSASPAQVPSVMKIFEPVISPAVAVALGASDDAPGIGAGTGLGQRVAAERLTGRKPRQPLLLLLLGAPLPDRLPDEPDVDGDDPPDRRVRAAELLHDEAVRDGVELPACEKPDLGELGNDLPVHRLVAIPLARMWRHLPVDELARRPADELLFGGQREIHNATGPAYRPR